MLINFENLKTAINGIILYIDAKIKNIKVPTKLPNPSSITFTGGATGSYDGSSAVTIDIPQGGGSQVQSDWNQNDETAPDYIKNRVCYVKYKKCPLLTAKSETEVDFIYSNEDAELAQVFNTNKTLNIHIGDRKFRIEVTFDRGHFFWNGEYVSDPTIKIGGAGYWNAGYEWSFYVSSPMFNLGEQYEFRIDEFSEIKKMDPIFSSSKGVSGTGLLSEIFNDSSNKASGDFSHAEGLHTTASGFCSHAEGGEINDVATRGGTASGKASHAEGCYTAASGPASHAEGLYTTASGDYSHAEGIHTTASGDGSHAEGSHTTASGDYSSHAEGYETTASSNSQHVQGTYNIDDAAGKYVHIVGNGNYESNSNAHTLDWQGNSWYQGSVLVAGTNMDAPDAELNSNSVVIKSSTPGSAKRFRITVDDTGAIKATEIV